MRWDWPEWTCLNGGRWVVSEDGGEDGRIYSEVMSQARRPPAAWGRDWVRRWALVVVPEGLASQAVSSVLHHSLITSLFIQLNSMYGCYWQCLFFIHIYINVYLRGHIWYKNNYSIHNIIHMHTFGLCRKCIIMSACESAKQTIPINITHTKIRLHWYVCGGKIKKCYKDRRGAEGKSHQENYVLYFPFVL